jgi:phospholipase C
MDLFPQTVGTGGPGCPDYGHGTGLVMGYYDGNTVTALWNYAQYFAMNDNSYSTGFGPSSPGAINLVSGNTGNAIQDTPPSEGVDVNNGVLFDDAQPTGDKCTSRDSAHLTGKNIGNLLNAAGISWGWFQGGFDLTITNPNGTTGCKRTHPSVTGAFSPKVDYIPHHEPFQYYASTANPNHLRPSSIAAIGRNNGLVNHQYDSHDFFDALAMGNFPAVVFLKAPGYQDGHAGYSSPLDEQTFIVTAINKIEASAFWDSTAVFVLYDDSDGWYDHQMSPIVRHSQQSIDALSGNGLCGSSSNGIQAQGQCGYGPRQPFMVISGWAKSNFVDHTLTDQASITRFIEDNWNLGRLGSDDTYADAFAGTVENMFDFSKTRNEVLKQRIFLDTRTGEFM